MFTVDSTGQQTATVFHSMRVVENRIYIAGIGTRGVDSIYTNSGIFSSFDMEGHLLKNTYYGVSPTNSDFRNDVISLEPNNLFSLAGNNFNGTFSFWKINKEGRVLIQKTYRPFDTLAGYSSPSSITKINNNYAISTSLGNGRVVNPIVYIIDSVGNQQRIIEITHSERFSQSTKVIRNRNNKLTLSSFKTSYMSIDTNYVYVSQIREIDTAGNIKWTYETPRNRYIYIKKFIQLANGNYLVWGDEELPKIVGLYRSVTDVRPYLAEINPQKGIVWESKIGLIGRMYGFKMLRDSSMVLSCTFDIGFSDAMSCIIKLNKNRDSLYRRNFRPSSINSSRVIPFPNQIEELENGDLLISGYVEDRMANSPTVGQWGWLIRTDSLGCSLEPSSCRTPTKDIKEYPLSIKTFPNPTSSNLTIDFDIQASFKTASFSLIDITGREILNQKIENNQKQVVWQTESLPRGLYFIALKIDNRIIYQTKVSVQK